MANSLFSFSPFDLSGIQGVDCPILQDYEKAEAMKGKQDPLFSIEELGQVYPLCSDQYGPYQDHNHIANNGSQCFFKDPNQELQPHQSPVSKPNCLTLDEYIGSCFPAPALPIHEVKRSENITKSSKEISKSSALSSSLDLLKNYGSGLKKLNLNQFSSSSNQSNAETRKVLSTEEIMRIAGTRYIQFSDQRYDDFSMLMHPFGYALSGLSEEETGDVELAHLLLAAAEKVGYQQYDRANRLLSRCEWISSEQANPVQRVVYCFAEALRGRIDKATGRFFPKDINTKCETPHCLGTNLATLRFHQKVPFNQITQLASIQSIMDNIGLARKLHVIDLEIRSGVQWTAMMQALAEREQRPLEHLRVTAVGLESAHSKLEETGMRLKSFAKSVNFAFTYKAICVSSMSAIKEELFQISGDESLVVVANMFLRTLVQKPNCLENLMTVIKNLNPLVVVVTEVEANHNSPIFVNRFIEALFFYSAYFDCLEACMNENREEKSAIEAAFSHGIREIVALEDNERIGRSVKIDVWRAFFARFRMVEIGFSESCLYQASLVSKQFASGDLCTFAKSDKCLLVGWKGTPLHSLSVWKFCRERLGRLSAKYRF